MAVKAAASSPSPPIAAPLGGLFENRNAVKVDVDDPFGELAPPLLRDMKAGMKDLLQMMNLFEIGSLCGALGLQNKGLHEDRVARILEYVREGKMKDAEKRFANVVRMTWECVLFEYLRYVGHPLHSARADPRQAVLRYWRRSGLASGSTGDTFVPYYLERQVKDRSSIINLDPDVEKILNELKAHEEAVKITEGKMRKDNDYRHVLDLLASNKGLHKYAIESVEYLSSEIKMARAALDHSKETSEVLESNVTEIEEAYNRAMEESARKDAEHQAQYQTTLKELDLSQESHNSSLNLASHIYTQEMKGPREDLVGACLDEVLGLIRERHVGTLDSCHADFKKVKDSIDPLESAAEQAKEEIKRLKQQLISVQADSEMLQKEAQKTIHKLEGKAAASHAEQQRLERIIKNQSSAINTASVLIIPRLGSFAPREAESALNLLQTLQIDSASYSHILEAKAMLIEDMKARAWATLEAAAAAAAAEKALLEEVNKRKGPGSRRAKTANNVAKGSKRK